MGHQQAAKIAPKMDHFQPFPPPPASKSPRNGMVGVFDPISFWGKFFWPIFRGINAGNPTRVEGDLGHKNPYADRYLDTWRERKMKYIFV